MKNYTKLTIYIRISKILKKLLLYLKITTIMDEIIT